MVMEDLVLIQAPTWPPLVAIPFAFCGSNLPGVNKNYDSVVKLNFI